MKKMFVRVDKETVISLKHIEAVFFTEEDETNVRHATVNTTSGATFDVYEPYLTPFETFVSVMTEGWYA